MSYAEENREEVPDTRPQTVSLFKQCQMDPSSPLIDPLTDGIVEGKEGRERKGEKGRERERKGGKGGERGRKEEKGGGRWEGGGVL